MVEAGSVASVVNDRYGLEMSEARFLHQGFNDTYEITSGGVGYMLRLYCHGRRSLEEIQSECDLLLYLKSSSIPVCAPLPALDKSLIFEVTAPEGLRHGVLFEKAAGTICSSEGAKNSRGLGALLGRLHTTLGIVNFCPVRRPVDRHFLLDSSIEILRSAFPHHGKAISKLERRFDRNLMGEDPFSSDGGDYGLVHGDFIRTNVFEQAKGSFTVIDFDFCGNSSRLYDLASYKWSLLMINPATADELFNHFLAGYMGTASLSDEPLRWLDWLVDVRHLWVWALDVGCGHDFRRYNENRFHHMIQFFS